MTRAGLQSIVVMLIVMVSVSRVLVRGRRMLDCYTVCFNSNLTTVRPWQRTRAKKARQPDDDAEGSPSWFSPFPCHKRIEGGQTHFVPVRSSSRADTNDNTGPSATATDHGPFFSSKKSKKLGQTIAPSDFNFFHCLIRTIMRLFLLRVRRSAPPKTTQSTRPLPLPLLLLLLHL